ncbi:MAG: hypothetical protein PHS46_07905 [Candidatus Omnitrophica bacterium]|nr:hypothetical protein [Candidatus Omnitrophota bacterium]
MKRLSVMLEDDAFQILKDYQEKHKIGTRDEAATAIIREFAKKRRGSTELPK